VARATEVRAVAASALSSKPVGEVVQFRGGVALDVRCFRDQPVVSYVSTWRVWNRRPPGVPLAEAEPLQQHSVVERRCPLNLEEGLPLFNDTEMLNRDARLDMRQARNR